MGDWVWRGGEWVHDPELPTPVTASDYDPSATRVGVPAVGGRVEYADSVDYVSTRATDTPGRVNDWCEDRPAAELSDDDGRD